MQPCQPALVDQVQRPLEHIFRFCRKAGDQISTKCDVGACRSDTVTYRDSFIAAMPALHTLQDHVVTRLQRQVKMRHQPWFVVNQPQQVRVHFDAINRRNPQSRQLGHLLAATCAPFAPMQAVPGRSDP